MERISDLKVCEAYYIYNIDKFRRYYPHQILAQWLHLPEEECYKACERANRAGYVVHNDDLKRGMLTKEGEELLKQEGRI